MLQKPFCPALLTVILAAATISQAQDYPNRVLRIVTSAAGASGDLISRLIAQESGPALGQPVIVENRASNIAPEVVAKAPADGYTLLEGGSVIWLTPLMQRKPNWDVAQDFAPVTLVERTPNVLVIHPSLPVKSVTDLISLARSRPDELNYATSAAGGSSHLAGELFKQAARVRVVWVPYKGSAQAAIAMMSGEAQIAFSNAGSVLPLVKARKLIALATTGTRPSLIFPRLTTIADAGLPGFEVESIDAIFVPARTPSAIVRRLNQEIVRALNRPDSKRRLLTVGAEIATSSPEQLATLITSETARWGRLIREANIRVD